MGRGGGVRWSSGGFPLIRRDFPSVFFFSSGNITQQVGHRLIRMVCLRRSVQGTIPENPGKIGVRMWGGGVSAQFWGFLRRGRDFPLEGFFQ